MLKNGNPLIHENKADTISHLKNYVEWLCRSADGDDEVHPGMVSALHVVRVAVESLQS